MKHKVRIKGRLRLYFQASLLMGILLAVIDFYIINVDWKAGAVLAAFVLLYLLTSLILLSYNRTMLMNELISFATQYGQIQKQLLRDLELPHALLDENGKILWMNKMFETVVHKEKGYHKSITTIFPEITKDKLPGEQDFMELKLSHDENDYHVKLKKIPLKEMVQNSDMLQTDEEYDGYLTAIYLFDETALNFALLENDNQSLVTGLLYIDNYEEALETVEEVRRSLLTAIVERKLNKYFGSLDGIVKKMEKDKFFVIIRKKSLKQLMEKKFDLLEEIKTINIGNEMSLTLSIGIGSDGLSYAQNYEFSKAAIDLALGRGGDQAVVKTPSGVTYYGGKSQQMEKNTRVKARVKAQALRELITTKERVLVMGHRMTDVDSFGASVGIYRAALTLGREAHIVIDDINSTIKPLVDAFMSNAEEEEVIVNHARALELSNAGTVLVVVDVNRPSITECPELLKSCRTIVVLDHHRKGDEVVENATLSYVEPYASSACELVAEILQYIGDGVKIKGSEADCLYAGIMIDTNNFMTKTGVRTFEAAAFLRRNGADVTRVRKMFRDDADDYRAKADTVSRATIYENEYAISVCHSDGVESPTVIGAQAANELLNINGIKASFVFTPYNQMIYISARSIDEVNVQIIMEKLGGGGHMNIAGAQLTDVSVEQAVSRLKETLSKMIQEGEI
ncbi:MAG: DHH family phosphoesterase [Lachnospiraceae bacterium]|nr:DHH family phosphoesterase [Lachnospiraceae bacterium]